METITKKTVVVDGKNKNIVRVKNVTNKKE